VRGGDKVTDLFFAIVRLVVLSARVLLRFALVFIFLGV
jgi:hypothetical protein